MSQSLQALSQDKRSKILEAAQNRFLYYGVAKTTMRDIATDLGIAVSNLYLYFENKRELVLAIAQDCRNEQDRVLVSVLADASLTPPKKLEALLLARFECVNLFRNVYPQGKELIAYLLQEFPERHSTWLEHLERAILTVLEEGIRLGCFHIDEPWHSAHMVRVATAHFFLPAHVVLPTQPTKAELVALIRWLIPSFEASKAGRQTHG
jgi:TetR/AcrR family transcriptional regulator